MIGSASSWRPDVGTGFGATWPRARAVVGLTRAVAVPPGVEVLVSAGFCGGRLLPGRGRKRAKAAIAYDPVRFSHLPRDGSESGVRDVRSPRSLAAPVASWRFGS